nr:hypothetical protein [Tanacetum cinerariifolium]
MLEKGRYDTWKSCMLLYIEGKEHGHMVLDSILKGLFEYKVVDFPANEALGTPAQSRMQTFKDLSPEDKIKKECDIRAANIILYGLLNDIYTLLNHKTLAYEIWYTVKELMEGTELTKQEKDSKLAYEFENFTSEKGEMIQSYYIRFVTRVKQAKNLHQVSFDQLYAYLKQNELDGNDVRAMKARILDPLALIAESFFSTKASPGRSPNEAAMECRVFKDLMFG